VKINKFNEACNDDNDLRSTSSTVLQQSDNFARDSHVSTATVLRLELIKN